MGDWFRKIEIHIVKFKYRVMEKGLPQRIATYVCTVNSEGFRNSRSIVHEHRYMKKIISNFCKKNNIKELVFEDENGKKIGVSFSVKKYKRLQQKLIPADLLSKCMTDSHIWREKLLINEIECYGICEESLDDQEEDLKSVMMDIFEKNRIEFKEEDNEILFMKRLSKFYVERELDKEYKKDETYVKLFEREGKIFKDYFKELGTPEGRTYKTESGEKIGIKYDVKTFKRFDQSRLSILQREVYKGDMDTWFVNTVFEKK